MSCYSTPPRRLQFRRVKALIYIPRAFPQEAYAVVCRALVSQSVSRRSPLLPKKNSEVEVFFVCLRLADTIR